MCVVDGIAELWAARSHELLVPNVVVEGSRNLLLAIITPKIAAFCPRGEISIGQFPWPPVSTAKSYRLLDEAKRAPLLSGSV